MEFQRKSKESKTGQAERREQPVREEAKEYFDGWKEVLGCSVLVRVAGAQLQRFLLPEGLEGLSREIKLLVDYSVH